MGMHQASKEYEFIQQIRVTMKQMGNGNLFVYVK
jgi:hypothetical protein